MAKAMCLVGMLDGQIIGPIWVEGSMDQFVYKEMLEEHVLPLIKNKRGIWFMQNGATCRTSTMNLKFLKQHFRNRLISNKSEIRWPQGVRTATSSSGVRPCPMCSGGAERGSGGLLYGDEQGAGQESVCFNKRQI